MRVMISPLRLFNVRTSAASTAASPGGLLSGAGLLPPTVLPDPPTAWFLVEAAFALAGTEAFVAGVGAEPRVLPGPSKASLDCLPQRLPIGVAGVDRGW